MSSENSDINWLMKLDEVAAYFKVSVHTIRLWIDDGKLKAERIPNPKNDLNPNPTPGKPKTKWRPAREARSTLYVTWDALIARAKVYYGTEDKK